MKGSKIAPAAKETRRMTVAHSMNFR